MVPCHSSTREDGRAFPCFDAVKQSTFDRRQLRAKSLITDHLSPQDLDLSSSPRDLKSSFDFCAPLKAIPLTSYYHLHRVPSVFAMTEPAQTSSPAVELPKHADFQIGEQQRMPENGVHNKILEHVVRTPGRQPSPQPTHLSVPGTALSKILHEEGPGYVAPKFEGKELQMDLGKLKAVGRRPSFSVHGLIILPQSLIRSRSQASSLQSLSRRRRIGSTTSLVSTICTFKPRLLMPL